MNIEDTISDCGLPVNAIAMISRLRELMDEHGTNSLSSIKEDVRVRKVMWLINQQVYGQLATIDMCDEWDELVLKPTFEVLNQE